MPDSLAAIRVVMQALCVEGCMTQTEYDDRADALSGALYERKHAELAHRIDLSPDDAAQLADEWLERSMDRLDTYFMADRPTDEYDAAAAVVAETGEVGVDV